MSALRVWTSVICSALLAGLSVAANAAPPTGKTGKRVVVYPAPDESAASLEQAGLSNIKKRGSYWLADVADTRWQSAKRKPGTRIESADYFTIIELSEVSFDVTQGEPKMPAHLLEVVGTGKGLRLVQFKGPVTPEWLEQLKAIAGVRLIHPIPNNAYLIAVRDMAEDGVMRLVAPDGLLQWVGGYHPYYKVPASLREATGLVGIKVAVLDDADEAVSVAAVQRYANGPVESRRSGMGQTILTLRVNAGDVAAVAQVAGVLWIQPALPVTTRDEVQALVLTGNLTPGPGDTRYLDFLSGKGFLANSSVYPVLDICDTGVDAPYPHCNPVDQFSTWHPAFYSISLPVSPDFSCCLGLRSRKAYISGVNTDTDGHGTRVASIAIGFDTQPDEPFINCYGQQFGSNCVTTITPQQICTTNGFDFAPCIGNFPPLCCTDSVNFPFGCPRIDCVDVIITNISCTVTCAVTDASIDNALPPPPWYLSRRDLNGFQLGLGVSPFGRFGVSSMDAAKANPEGVAAGIYIAAARISNNSWTEGLIIGSNDGTYNDLCQSYDKLTRDALPTGLTNAPGQAPKNQSMLFIFAAGNDNGSIPGGGFGDVLITPPATAKNVITVGATVLGHSLLGSGNPNQISSSSSFGPTRDGRFKPDLVAPGSGVAGAISQATYTHTVCGGCDPNNPTPFACEENFFTQPVISKLYNRTERTFPEFTAWPFPNAGGSQGVTSYAAPAVAGGAQLLFEYIQRTFSLLPPSPALMKTYLLNSARYLPIINPLTGTEDQLPSIAQGMGMMDLSRMFDGVARLVRDESTPRAVDSPLYPTNTVVQQTYFTAAGQTYEVDGQIADPGQEFRVTIAWTDVPGNPAVLKQLVNNLDLEVTVNGQLYTGNDFATRYAAARVAPRYDSLNNVESVFLPAGTTGTWKVVVRAVEIAGDGVINVGSSIDQDFALVVYNGTNPSDSDNTATNNACQTAKNIGGFPFSWTNQLSKAVYRNTHPSPSLARGGSDEFFVIPNPSPGTVFTVNTFGSSFDTILSVWRGSCGSLVEQISNNNSSNTLQSAVSFTADGTNDYYIVAEPANDGPGGQLILNVRASSSPVTLTPTNLVFGAQIAGGLSSTSQVVTVRNGLSVPLNLQTVTLQGPDASDFQIIANICSEAVLPTNGTCTVQVVFTPVTAGLKTAVLIITDNATGSPRSVPISGLATAPAPIFCPEALTALAFGTVATDSISPEQLFVITNCGTANLFITNAVVIGAASNEFVITTDICSGNTIAPGAACTLGVQFVPQTSGVRSATLRINDNTSASPHLIILSGTGRIPTPSVCFNAGSVNFGSVAVETTSAASSVTVSNCGTAPLIVNSVSLTGAGASQFILVTNDCLSGSIATGSVCTVQVQLAPTAIGPISATLQITDNAPGSPHTIALNGLGTGSQPDGQIAAKNKAKFYLGNNVINLTGESQEVFQKGKRAKPGKVGKPRYFFISVQNDGNTTDSFTVSGPTSLPGFASIRYFLGASPKQDLLEITGAVGAGTYSTASLAAGATTGDATLIRVEFIVDSLAVAGSQSFVVTLTSTSNPAKQDAVKGTITVK